MALELRNITHSFGDHEVLSGLNLRLEEGQTLAVLGASGCGKTTLLKGIAGLLKLTAGEVSFHGLRMDTLAPEDRGLVYLSQEPSLFPHLNVFENVAFGLRLRRNSSISREAIKSKVHDMLKALDLLDHAQKRPHQLSGGQKQRVAFGRALVVTPRVVLLDEPFGSLDAGTRREMQHVYRMLACEHRFTALFITHDLKEAIITGDQLAKLAQGKLKRYDGLEDVAADKTTGLSAELEFWKDLENQT